MNDLDPGLFAYLLRQLDGEKARPLEIRRGQRLRPPFPPLLVDEVAGRLVALDGYLVI